MSETAERHSFLNKLMRTKANEDLSYENAINCGMALTAGILACCVLEVATYFIYLHEVRSAECKSLCRKTCLASSLEAHIER